MGKIAFVFPGQASQYSGMGKQLYDNYTIAASLFKKADNVLPFSISELCFLGSEEELKLTEKTQPAILTVSVAVYKVLESLGIEPDCVAGHSLGEYSAIVAAGGMKFSDAVQVVHKRGKFMQEAVNVGVGSMAALLGGSLEDIKKLCEEVRGSHVLTTANINCPGQVVISGHKEAVDMAIANAPKIGVKKAVILPVSAPFHCDLMRPAQEKLKIELNKINIRDLKIPLIANYDAEFTTSSEDVREKLIKQVSSPVLWQDSVEKLISNGVDTFVEVGPKKVLSGMIKKISREVKIYHVETPEEIEKFQEIYKSLRRK